MYARVWVKIWTCTLSGLEIHGMTVQCFLKRESKEFWLASSFEGHGSSLRSLPHPSLYPRTPLIWFEQQNLFFNLRLAMIWHVFLFNFLQWLQNTQEAPCLCHSRPGWYETIRDQKSVSVAVMKILRSVRQNQYGVHLPQNGQKCQNRSKLIRNLHPFWSKNGPKN